jgi:prepilin-type N-terminal cleavage/methylation domain-containing protein
MHLHRPTDLQGFTLIEVLAALSIVAVTMLGVGALHLEALTSGRRSLERLEAVSLATALADTIRAFTDAPAAATGRFATAGDVAACDAAVPCPIDAMVDQEIALWRAAVADNVGRTPEVTVTDPDPTGPGRYQIAVPLPGLARLLDLEVLA